MDPLILICDASNLMIVHASQGALRLLETDAYPLQGSHLDRWLSPHESIQGQSLADWLGHQDDEAKKVFESTLNLGSGLVAQWQCCFERFEDHGMHRLLITLKQPLSDGLENKENLIRQNIALNHSRIVAGGMAHEINNQLTPLMLTADLIQESSQGSDREIFEKWQREFRKLTASLKGAFDYLKTTDSPSCQFDPAGEIQSFMPMLHAALRHSPKPYMAIGKPVSWVQGRRADMHLIVLSLCLHFKQAEQKVDHIQINLCDIILEPSTLKAMKGLPSQVKAGNHVCIRISDRLDKCQTELMPQPPTQDGIPEDLQGVKLIVESMRGFITAHINKQSIHTFELYFPAEPLDSEPIIKESPLKSSCAADQKKIETPQLPGPILYVEDEEPLRKIAGAVLTRAGHEIIFAQNGIDALAKLTQVGKNLSLIITDVAMPEMDGIEFAGLARQLHPNLPIVVVSGRFDQSILENLDDLSIHQRLHKPFTAGQLKEAVQLVLRRSENLT